MFKQIWANKYAKIILTCLAIAFGGFFLLNLTFMIYGAVAALLGLFVPGNYFETHRWYIAVPTIMGTTIVLYLVWLAFRSKLSTFWKSLFVPIPTAVVLVMLGVSTYQRPVITYSVGALLVGATFYFFYHTKQPWLYYFGVGITALALVIMGILGVDI